MIRQQLAVLRAKQLLAESRKQKISLLNQLTKVRNKQNSLHLRYQEIIANFNMRKEALNQQLATINQADGYTILSPIDGKVSSLLVSKGSIIAIIIGDFLLE